MRRIFIALITLGLWAPIAPAHAQKRIALLIGNQAYSAEVGALKNPHNDVALLERTLKALQFNVTVVRDASLSAMHQAVNQHVRRVRGAGTDAVGLLYYSGHGAADATTGINYLIPIDVKSADDGELWDVSLRLTEITRKLKGEASNATHFIVFDACRNALKIRKAGTRTLLQSKGFVPLAQENGMLIAYATAEGELASDVGDGAGPYAKVLAEEIAKPGVEAVVMFRVVQRRVRAAIGQEPYLGFSALGDIYLAGAEPPNAPPIAAPVAPAQPASSEAERAWALAKDTTSVAVLEAFIDRYKDTFFADLARARITELKRQQMAVPAPPPKMSGGGVSPPDGPLADWMLEMKRANVPNVAPHFLIAALCSGCSDTAFYCRAPIASVANLKGKTVGIASNLQSALSSQLQGVGATVIPYKATRNVASDVIAELIDCAAFQK